MSREVAEPMSRSSQVDSANIEVFRIAFAPVVALVIALVGWIITTSYNATQTRIAQEKNATDAEVARTNASIRFVELLDAIEPDDLERRSRLLSASYSVLPAHLAFDVAVQGLEYDRGTIEALFAANGGDAWQYLEPHLARGPTFRRAEHVEQIQWDESSLALIEFLSTKGLTTGLESHLFQGPVSHLALRERAILNYFRYLNESAGVAESPGAETVRHAELVTRTLTDPSVSDDLKNSVALCGAAVFSGGQGDLRDTSLLEFAADRFWNPMDVGRGELPQEETVHGFVYRHRLYYEHGDRTVGFPGIRERLSESLWRELEEIDKWDELSWERVRLLWYAYAVYTPRGSSSPFVAYLAPSESLALTRKVLHWASTPERREAVSRELASLSGSRLYRNLSGDEQSQRRFAEAVFTFYEEHSREEWWPPKLLSDICQDNPEFRARVRPEWGVGIAD